MAISRRFFIRQSFFGALQFGLASEILARTGAETSLKETALPRSSPESQGISSQSLLDFLNAVEQTGEAPGGLNLHSLMVVRNGNVIAEGWWAPYAAPLKHTLYSLSKSFTSTGIGFAVAEGKLKVSDPVVSFFPGQLPADVSPNLKAMRVQDLLVMGTGHDKDTTPAFRKSANSDWVKAFLAQPVVHKPGTHFVYNSGATYMLSAILQKVTGNTLLEYLTPRLFTPLGISGMDWETDPRGICTGGWGLRLRTEDIARFGQLYLQKGTWQGKRLLPESWILEATTSHIASRGGSRNPEENDWLQGYGYQFWRCRHNAYRGDGAFGQYCIVVPDRQLVIAITSETSDMQAVLDLVWKYLLPAAAPATGLTATDRRALSSKLSGMTLPVVEGIATSPVIAVVNGKKYTVTGKDAPFTEISFRFNRHNAEVSIVNENGRQVFPVGIHKWLHGNAAVSIESLKLIPTPVPGGSGQKVAASGAWTAPDTFEMLWRYTETAHYQRIVCTFKNDSLTLALQRSIALLSKSAEPPLVLEGRQRS